MAIGACGRLGGRKSTANSLSSSFLPVSTVCAAKSRNLPGARGRGPPPTPRPGRCDRPSVTCDATPAGADWGRVPPGFGDRVPCGHRACAPHVRARHPAGPRFRHRPDLDPIGLVSGSRAGSQRVRERIRTFFRHHWSVLSRPTMQHCNIGTMRATASASVSRRSGAQAGNARSGVVARAADGEGPDFLSPRAPLLKLSLSGIGECIASVSSR